MISKETIIRRLSIAKYLFQLGWNQSQQPESIAFSSILSFHDAIEIFLKLAAEKENIKSENFRFLEYWDKISTLTLKESMRHLNERRVNLKHKGILPAKQDLEISRVNVTDFFNQNTQNVFGISFPEVSLINLVSYASVRSFLELAQNKLDHGQMDDCVENSAYAFYELLDLYEKSKTDVYRNSPFFFGKKKEFHISPFNKLKEIDREVANTLTEMAKSISAMQQSLKIVSFGIDYKKYSKFKILTPTVTKRMEKYHAELWDYKKWTKDNCQFCIDFVIESSLRLQDFDFEITHLIDDPPIMEYVSGDFETGLVFREIPRQDKKENKG